MKRAGEVFRRLRAVMRGRTADDELDDEVRFHLEMEAAKLMRLGHLPADARRRARVGFGAVERFRDEAREQRGIVWLENVLRELRLSLRRLVREPGFTVAAVTTLAIGFGANAAVFALIDGVLLRPLPYPASDRLVVIGHTVHGERADGGLSDGLAAYYADRAESFDMLGTVLENEISMTDGDAAERVHVAMLTPELLAALAARPALGQFFDTGRGAPDNQVLISWSLWQRRYGGDPDIIGRRIETNRTADVVVGVMPRAFDFPRPETDVWMGWPRDDTRAGLHDLYLTGVGRLRPGLSPADARQELSSLLARLRERFPDVSEEQLAAAQLRPVVEPLKDARTADVRAPLVVLLVLVCVVLVIAWANVANLVLLRGDRQRREFLIARALGASTGALVRRVLLEGALISVAAGAIAATLAAVAVSVRFGFGAGEIARLHEVSLSARVLLACGALVTVTALLLAAVAWASVRQGAFEGLRPASASRVTTSRSARRTQHTLAGVQVALALVLLVACGAAAQSLYRLLHVDPGFDPAHTVLFELNPPARPYLSYGAASELHATIRDEIEALAGVERVEGAFALPLQPRIMRLRETVAVDGTLAKTSAATVNMVTPGFFDALGIAVVSGRSFQPQDLTAATPGVVLSARLARDLFGEADPIGRTVTLTDTRSPGLHVVGVAGDVVGETLAAGPVAVLYLPAIFAHTFDAEFRAGLPYVPRELTVIVRTTLPAAAIAPAIRRVIDGIDSKLPVTAVLSADALVARATARARLVTLLLTVASGSALFLGAVGLWGVVAYMVTQRTPELAIRIAVGAQPRSVAGLMLRQGLVIAALGILAGGALAFALMRSLAAVLFDVRPAEPAVFAVAAALLFVIATSACYAPARRALRVDPARLLRAE